MKLSGISGLEGMLKSDDFVFVRYPARIARRTVEIIVPHRMRAYAKNRKRYEISYHSDV